MELHLLIGCIAVILFFVLRRLNSRVERKVHKKNTYSYTTKGLPMTQAEADFFQKLESAVSGRYYVFLQMHLTAILDHHVKGQEWGYAFKHINGKSVDYVLCDKATLRPAYAI